MKIPIVFAINDGYVKQLSAVLVSILENAASDVEFDAYVLTLCVSCENRQIIKSLSKRYPNITINFVDMNTVVQNHDLEKYMSRRVRYNYISIETYFRFFIPELFEQYEKILYLDADIIVLKDISKLYSENIEGYYAGVIKDTIMEASYQSPGYKTETPPFSDYVTYFKDRLGKKDSSYFNAGVMLLNVKKIREDNVVEKFWQCAIEKGPFDFQDQDIMNIVLEGSVKYLDDEWNALKDIVFYSRHIKDKKRRKHLLKMFENPGIVHYVGSNKPWLVHKDEYLDCFIDEWWKYYRLTPYYNEEMDEAVFRSIKFDLTFDRNDIILLKLFNITLFAVFTMDGMLKINFVGLKTRIKLPQPKGYLGEKAGV